MFISKVSLVNYRNFANAFFIFNRGINTIIGENGAGKTNLFRAIRLLLEDASYPFAYKLDYGDFNRSIADWRGQWIIISIEFDEISTDEAIQSLFIHGSGNIEEKNFVKKATYNLFFRPKAEIRMKLSELEEGDKEGLEDILSTITINNINDKYETFFTGKSVADFNNKDVYKDLVGDFDNVKFNYSIDTSKYGIKIPHQLCVAKEISFTFIKALRDVVTDFHNNRTNPLLTLLKNQSGEIKEEDFLPISKLVKSLNEGIETLPDVQKIRDDIKETIKDAVGVTYSPSSLSIKSSLSDEANKLLQSLKLFIGEPDETYEGGIHELSLGGANLIFLTLKLLEYKYQKSKDTFANFLIIEEPEAHIHTHIQKTLFDKLDYGDTQIIYSTHSTHISEVCNIENINILSKKVDFAEVYQPANNLQKENINQLQRYLDAIRSNLLFAKGIMLVEGDAEEILIPLMVKKVLGVSLDELGISLINIRSTGFENVAQIFHQDRINRRCSILTDLDAEICDTKIISGDTDKIKAYKTKVKKSSDAGRERRTRLDSFAKGNSYIKVFYADYTFEVDFVKAGNAWEVTQTLEKIYEKALIEKARKEIKSDKPEVYGKRVLTMAKQEGKGWFAILVGKHISYRTIIPGYILKAIVFARSTFNDILICDIIYYRLTSHKASNSDHNINYLLNITTQCKQGKKSLQEVISEFEEVFPDDQVIDFFKLL